MAVTLLARTHLPFFTALLLASAPSDAQQSADLTDLSFEELLSVDITSVSRREQPLSEAAAAVFVITNEDLRRSGATSIPEALRMAPGLQVSQLDANKWSVSARGFASRFANKLLVLVDGRTVYTPGFSGVYWEQLDVMLEDVERIEVIRGPGATLWGANAVNGVINVITKPAAQTQGGLAAFSAGSEERATGLLRYGAKLGEGVHGRAFVKYAEHDDLMTESGSDGGDSWDIRHGGFRLDSELSSGDRLSLQGDTYRGDYNQNVLVPSLAPPTYLDRFDSADEGSGWNLLGRWERPLSVSSDLALQVYYDHFERRENAFPWQDYDTLDIDFQHRSSFADRHNLIWGLGYRRIQTETRPTVGGAADFDSLTTELWSGFIQDEIELIDDKLRLTLGSKFEHNDFTGFEYQPNARLLWQMDDRNVLWAAVSRAVRTPSLGEQYLALDTQTIPPLAPPFSAPLPTLVVAQGNEDFETEELLAYELGFRANPDPSVSLDLALFYNEYDNLRTVEASVPRPASDGPYLVFATPFANKASGNVYGAELAAEWLIRQGWRLAGAYSFAKADPSVDSDSVDTTNDAFAKTLPRHQLSLRSMLNLGSHVDLDVWVRYVDSQTGFRQESGVASPRVSNYWDLDVRLAWRAREGLELSLVGQNLLQDSRLEGTQEILSVVDSEVQRGVYGTLKLEF